MIGDAQHGDIIECVKVVFSDSALSAWLFERYGSNWIPYLTQKSTKIGIGILQFPQNIDDDSVEKTGACCIFNKKNLGDPGNKSIIGFSD